jgi:hypothetical protein
MKVLNNTNKLNRTYCLRHYIDLAINKTLKQGEPSCCCHPKPYKSHFFPLKFNNCFKQYTCHFIQQRISKNYCAKLPARMLRIGITYDYLMRCAIAQYFIAVLQANAGLTSVI